MIANLKWRNSKHRVNYKVLDYNLEWFTLKDMFGAISKISVDGMRRLEAKITR